MGRVVANDDDRWRTTVDCASRRIADCDADCDADCEADCEAARSSEQAPLEIMLSRIRRLGLGGERGK